MTISAVALPVEAQFSLTMAMSVVCPWLAGRLTFSIKPIFNHMTEEIQGNTYSL
jgi:hypothetical protein